MKTHSVTLYSSSHGETALAANALCQACGMCCNGVLFSHITLRGDDLELARKAGMPVRKVSKDKTVCALPCRKFKDGCCSVYEMRPGKCRDYYCGLQRDVMNGSLPAAEAEALIAHMTAEADWLLEQGAKLTGKEKGKLNLREFLYSLHKQAGKTLQEKGLSKGDIALIGRAFQFAKLVDRHFKVTEFLTRLADLVQAIERKENAAK